MYIFGEMEKCDFAFAGVTSKYVSRIVFIVVLEKYFGKVIGKGGEIICFIMEKIGVENIDVNKEKEMVFVIGGVDADFDAAIRMIEGMIVELEVGKIYCGCVVKKVVEFGCFVEYLLGFEGFVYISEFDVLRVLNVFDVTFEGAVMDVKIIVVDNCGKISLSCKEVLLEENLEFVVVGFMFDDSVNERNGGGGGRGGGGRGGRGGRVGSKRDSGGFKCDLGGF